MDYNPKVSIVIPVYNGSNYLRQAIDSALAQTYRNLEVMVVNDGSNDGGKTEAIAKSYGDRIRYFAKLNGGVASALNLGIREMTGEWFSWLSHDDCYYPEKIEAQIRLAADNPDAKVIFCNAGTMDAAGHTISENHRESMGVVRGGIAYWHIWIYACSLLIHKSCFDVVGLLNESNHTCQDTELVLLLLHHFDVYHLPQVLAKWRLHPESGGHVYGRELGAREYVSLIRRLLDEYGIGLFFPGLDSGRSSLQSLAAGYQELGDHHLHWWQKPVFSHCHRTSVQLWPSLLNTSLYKLLLGRVVVSWWIQSRRVRRRIAWSLVRVGRMPRRIVRASRIVGRTLRGHPVSQWSGLLRDLWMERQRRLRGVQ